MATCFQTSNSPDLHHVQLLTFPELPHRTPRVYGQDAQARR